MIKSKNRENLFTYVDVTLSSHREADGIRSFDCTEYLNDIKDLMSVDLTQTTYTYSHILNQ